MTGYVDQVPILPEGMTSKEKIAEYYEQKNKFRQVSLFSDPIFESKFDAVAQNCQ